MQDHAKKIAATYSVDPTGWKKAGDEIRQPYWDWAVNTVPPDEVIALKQVTIVTPDGKRTAVDNPLYNYTFHPVDSSFPSDFQKWRTTLRQPTTEGADATDNVALLRKYVANYWFIETVRLSLFRSILRNVQLSTTAKTYNMLTRVNTWPAFSNHTVGDDGSGSNSLEAIHDGIHYNVGGLGHMGNTAVAGIVVLAFSLQPEDSLRIRFRSYFLLASLQRRQNAFPVVCTSPRCLGHSRKV